MCRQHRHRSDFRTWPLIQQKPLIQNNVETAVVSRPGNARTRGWNDKDTHKPECLPFLACSFQGSAGIARHDLQVKEMGEKWISITGSLTFGYHTSNLTQLQTTWELKSLVVHRNCCCPFSVFNTKLQITSGSISPLIVLWKAETYRSEMSGPSNQDVVYERQIEVIWPVPPT